MMQNELGQPVGEPLADPVVNQGGLSLPMTGRTCLVTPVEVTAHAADLFEAYSAATDDGDWTYLPYGPFADHAVFASWLAIGEQSKDPLFFSVLDAESKAVGIASYLRINDRSASIEVGHIHLSRELQGTVAATEAMYLMMHRAFACGYRRYEWKCDALNAPSRGAAARLGFGFEGIFRQHTHYKGRNRDTAWFGIIDSDWDDLAGEFRRWLDPANFDEAGQQLSPLANRKAA